MNFQLIEPFVNLGRLAYWIDSEPLVVEIWFCLRSMKNHLDQSWPSFEESLIAESRAYLRRGREKASEKYFEDFSGAFAEQYAKGYVEGRIAGHVEKVNELVGMMHGVDEELLAKAFCISVDAVRQIWSGEKYNPCPSILRACGIEG